MTKMAAIACPTAIENIYFISFCYLLQCTMYNETLR